VPLHEVSAEDLPDQLGTLDSVVFGHVSENAGDRARSE
jgi:hypothetical protein